MTRVLVAGAGITGLATAHTLAGLLPDGHVEVWEADDRLGGKLKTSPFARLAAVDEGADAFLARVPHGTALARTVGLGDELTSPTGATAAVWHDGLHPIPEGLMLGVPADLLKLLIWFTLERRAEQQIAIQRQRAQSQFAFFHRLRRHVLPVQMQQVPRKELQVAVIALWIAIS